MVGQLTVGNSTRQCTTGQCRDNINVFGFNSKRTISGRITYIAALRLQYLNHKELIKLFITTLGYLVILKQPWIKLYKVTINWDNLKLLFTASHCKQKCLMTCYSDPKPKSRKSIKIHQSKISTDVHPTPKKSTQFHLPENSTEFHQRKTPTDNHQEPKNNA